MSKYLNHTELIGAYLEGKMNPNEMLQFENQLHTDPVLRSEFELQQDIIHSIKDFRKAQLKARLDQVPVGAGPGGLVGIKAAAAIVLTGIIGLGTYIYFTTAEETPAEQVTENTIILDESLTSEESTPEFQPLIEEEQQVMEVSDTEQADRKNQPVANVPSEASAPEVKTPVAEPQLQEQEEPEAEVPVVNSPQLAELQMEETPADEPLEMPSAELAQKELIENPVVAVETNRKDDNLFHYQYYNGKLYLYGDFRDKPYEILELNSISGKRLYMYYENTYYLIMDDQREITPLQELKDQDIIKKLEIIQANK